jgi:hypothetical protein
LVPAPSNKSLARSHAKLRRAARPDPPGPYPSGSRSASARAESASSTPAASNSPTPNRPDDESRKKKRLRLRRQNAPLDVGELFQRLYPAKDAARRDVLRDALKPLAVRLSQRVVAHGHSAEGL